MEWKSTSSVKRPSLPAPRNCTKYFANDVSMFGEIFAGFRRWTFATSSARVRVLRPLLPDKNVAVATIPWMTSISWTAWFSFWFWFRHNEMSTRSAWGTVSGRIHHLCPVCTTCWRAWSLLVKDDKSPTEDGVPAKIARKATFKCDEAMDP